MAITWQAVDAGSVTSTPTANRPDFVTLSSPRDRFYEFTGSVTSGYRPTLTVRGSDAWGYYIEAQTNRGRRQFKFNPYSGSNRFRFGYRYDIALGDYLRNGDTHAFLLDLVALAEAIEPGINITGLGANFFRVNGDLGVAVDQGAVGDPPADDPPADDPPADDPPADDPPADDPPPDDPPADDPPPDDPPVVVDPPGGLPDDAGIVRFLNQATFGASDAGIAEVRAAGSLSAWIDQQLDLPPSLTEPYIRNLGNSSNSFYRHDIWWQNTMEGADQLRQRLAFAWSQIFVISDRDYDLSNSQYGVCNYYDMLGQLSDGNFRTLLERVTLHPVMGVYLSMVRNERADPDRNVRPDENFAREVLQLFTIGLDVLTVDGQSTGVPTFDQTTVEEFAKVFTGWNYDNVRGWSDNNIGTEARVLPMIANETFHDTSEKRLLNGAVLPAGQSAYADLTMALDNIFAHQNVGPFLARLLIQRLVTSNPTPGYIGRVAAVFNNNGQGVRGDLRATVKAILLDDEARSGPALLPDRFGKMKEPIMRLTNLWRAFDAQPGPQSGGRWRPYARPASSLDQVFGQAPMRAPSVFNFYIPDNPLTPGSALFAPEAQILTEINVASTNNMLLAAIFGDTNRSTQYRQNVSQIQIEPTVALAADIPALLDRLDTILCGGQLPPAIRSAIEARIAEHPDDDAGRFLRAVDSIYSIVGAPFHLVQK